MVEIEALTAAVTWAIEPTGSVKEAEAIAPAPRRETASAAPARYFMAVFISTVSTRRGTPERSWHLSKASIGVLKASARAI